MKRPSKGPPGCCMYIIQLTDLEHQHLERSINYARMLLLNKERCNYLVGPILKSCSHALKCNQLGSLTQLMLFFRCQYIFELQYITDLTIMNTCMMYQVAPHSLRSFIGAASSRSQRQQSFGSSSTKQPTGKVGLSLKNLKR